MSLSFDTQWLGDVRVQFEKLKRLAEGGLAQVEDDELNVRIDAQSNSLAVIVKHMAGNLRSRFTDFLTSDGEKPDRDRDGEFEIDGAVARQAMLEDWEGSWQVLFNALEALTPADLDREVSIRGERHSVMQALNRQLTHHAYHAGQIVFLAKHLRSTEWKTLSMPRRRAEPREPLPPC
ncbi:MAG: DUF1572 family protein [Acidobacteriota bacterium]